TPAGIRNWTLYSEGNRDLGGNSNGADFDATPGQAGNYLLVYRGNQAAPFDFSLLVTTADQAAVAPSGFNTPYSGTPGAGEVQTVTLTGTAGMAIYADSLDPTSSVSWRLTSPGGADIFSPRSASPDAGAFVLPESGTYTLTLQASTAGH